MQSLLKLTSRGKEESAALENPLPAERFEKGHLTRVLLQSSTSPGGKSYPWLNNGGIRARVQGAQDERRGSERTGRQLASDVTHADPSDRLPVSVKNEKVLGRCDAQVQRRRQDTEQSRALPSAAITKAKF